MYVLRQGCRAAGLALDVGRVQGLTPAVSGRLADWQETCVCRGSIMSCSLTSCLTRKKELMTLNPKVCFSLFPPVTPRDDCDHELPIGNMAFHLAGQLPLCDITFPPALSLFLCCHSALSITVRSAMGHCAPRRDDGYAFLLLGHLLRVYQGTLWSRASAKGQSDTTLPCTRPRDLEFP